MIRDSYDLRHEETGSGNIAKASPEWKNILDHARREPSGERYVLTEAYKRVNAQVKQGIPWSKCMDCGTPFIGVSDHCDNDCYIEAICDIRSSYHQGASDASSW